MKEREQCGAIKCLIWGTEVAYDKYINLIRYQELLGNIEVIGVTSNATIYERIDAYPFIPKELLKAHQFDVVIITADRLFLEIKQEAIARGFGQVVFIKGEVLSLPDFDIKQYIELYKNTPSIFSNNCWGGIYLPSFGFTV